MVATEELTEHSAPKWLTKDYLENVLRKYKNDKKIQISNLEIRPAIPKGENYASVMTRVKLTYTDGVTGKSSELQQVSVIVKTHHETDPRIAEIQKPYQMFQTEMAMYEWVLPKLTALLQQIGDNDKLFADTIYVDQENEAIIFEDLAVHDFGLADRIAGLDVAHTKLALKKLAKMHATAAVLNKETNGSLEKFSRGIFNRHTSGFNSLFENLIGVCADFAGDCPELGKYYKEKLLKLKAHVVEYATCAFDARNGDFHTLNHGDFWVNNVMVRYAAQQSKNGITKNANNTNQRHSKEIRDLLLIDFQFCSWTSPAIDLHYFFNTSLEEQLRLNNQDELVQYYHGILRETLMKLNYAGYIPTLHEFCVQMEARRFYAVTSSLVVQTFMINDNTEDADIEALLLNDKRARDFQRMLYRNKIVQENAKKLLPFFDRRGLLDVCD